MYKNYSIENIFLNNMYPQRLVLLFISLYGLCALPAQAMLLGIDTILMNRVFKHGHNCRTIVPPDGLSFLTFQKYVEYVGIDYSKSGTETHIKKRWGEYRRDKDKVYITFYQQETGINYDKENKNLVLNKSVEA